MSKKNIKANLKMPDMTAFLEKIGSRIDEMAEKVVAETGQEVLKNVRQKAYIAEDSYWHYWNNGQSKQRFAAGTLPKLLYSFTLPAWETKSGEFVNKIAVENNNETGFFGNVAVLLEYGTINMPPHSFFRAGVKTAPAVMKKVVERHFKEIDRQVK